MKATMVLLFAAAAGLFVAAAPPDGPGRQAGGSGSPVRGAARVQANSGRQARRPANSNRPATNIAEQFGAGELVSPGGVSSTLKLMLLFSVLSLAPSILIMTTCFIRFVIVTGLLKQAMGSPQLPPNQVVVSLCLFLTFLVMAPVWKQSYEEGIRPYTSGEPIPGRHAAGATRLEQAFANAAGPIRRFMAAQIEATGNSESVWMLLDYQQSRSHAAGKKHRDPPKNYDEVPLSVLLPAFMLSELKTAFLIGFQIFLPFLVIDMLVSSVLVSIGMVMLPPMLVSLPLKLLLFVIIDGWHLTVGMLLESIQPFS